MEYIKEMKLAREIRRKVLEMAYNSKSSHVASALSIADILTMLYFKYLKIDPANPLEPDRDIFILSKGHSCSALYAVLALRGFFGLEILDGYYKDGSPLQGHPKAHILSGVEASTGSLGHGLSIGAGLAFANRNRKVTVLMGDGECEEGSVWEAAMLSSWMKLDNLIAIIDMNNLQGMGRINEITGLLPLNRKWDAFGWNVSDIDGHDFKEMDKSFRSAFRSEGSRPHVIIAHTVKGKGVSFMEDMLEWHYRSPNREELLLALKELK